MGEMRKICSKCKQEKDISEFGIDRSRKNGYSYFCIKCWNIKGRKNVQKYKELRVKKNREWRKTESGKLSLSESRKRCRNKRKVIDPAFFVFETQRSRIKTILKQQKLQKKSKTQILLGCDLDHFKQYLESQFQEGMTWENRGRKEGWHIDHIVPGNYFDLSDPEQQKICFNYKNLQPLWKNDNLQKHTSLPDNYLEIIETIKKEIK